VANHLLQVAERIAVNNYRQMTGRR